MAAYEFNPKNELARMAIEVEQLVTFLCKQCPQASEDDLYVEIQRFTDRQAGRSFYNNYWTIRGTREFLEQHFAQYSAELTAICIEPAIADGVRHLRERWLNDLADVGTAALVYSLLRTCNVFPGRPQAA